MKNKITLFILFLTCSLVGFSQNPRTTVTLTDKDVFVSSYTDKEVVINNQTNLHLSATTHILTNSVIKLNSVDSWVFFDNVKPSLVTDSLLQYIYVNNQPAVVKTNTRISIYKNGTVIIPQPPTFQPLKVYTGQNFTGDSLSSYSLFTFYSALGALDNKIRSFKLKRGYMLTVATTSDGTGYSRVYIADDKDLEIPVLSNLVDQKISFIRILDWEWVSKKGWAGYNANDLNLTNSTWRYSWDAGGSTTSTVEYVPIRQNGGWPAWGDINAKTYVSHVLGFNEPDHTEQSNLTVSQALAEWPDMLRTGLRIGSPACTNFSWLYSFMDSCKAKNYRVDYVAVHAYWGGKSPSNWYNDLKYIHDRTGRPIWITEWNNGANWTTETWPTTDKSLSAANAAKQLADLKGILAVLDTASFIERYSIYNWVQDARAMTLGDTLTPAGKYYAADKSAIAFNRKYEAVPTFTYSNPSLTITTGATKLTLNIVDPNFENYIGCIIDKKVDNGSFVEFINSDNPSTIKFTDTININTGSRVRYRVRSKWLNGSVSDYSKEVGIDFTSGGDAVQYGTLSYANVGWNTVYFKKAFTSIPLVILGAPTNTNGSVLLSPRAKYYSFDRVFVQLAPWAYQGVSTLAKDESVPYFALSSGTYDFGGLKGIAGRASVGSTWTTITFASAFDTIPVVFATQLISGTVNATTVRIRNISKTGFEAKLQKETAVKTALGAESVSYFAIKPGTGIIDSKKLIVGRTADKAVSSIYSTIYYNDSIANPIFISQMQTCNDDTVTATLRCLTVSSKYANVLKQREKSTGVTSTLAETGGWMLINSVSETLGVNTLVATPLRIFPNPVKDYIYLLSDNSEKLNVEIYNMVGVLVKRVNVVDGKIDVNNLAPGCYMLKAANHTASKFIKL